ncbi:MAG: hypothetical protein JWP11_3604 [Frankiales bacterium]|nr:hypothetical protein [Frankiales bacterium]
MLDLSVTTITVLGLVIGAIGLAAVIYLLRQ